MYAPLLLARCKFDLRRWKWSGGYCAHARLFAFALDPLAVSLEKSFYGDLRSARRYDNLDAASVKDPHGESPGTIALAQYPSLSAILVRP